MSPDDPRPERDRRLPLLARRSAFTASFWDGLRAGVLRSTRAVCLQFSFPTKPFCPHCWYRMVDWAEFTGRVTLYSWTRVHAAPSAFAADVPYIVGVVDLVDGVRIATRILADAPAADRPVELIALAYGNLTLVAARPVG